ncbi:MAG: amidohydrolase family protein [Exilibacterium sp.]
MKKILLFAVLTLVANIAYSQHTLIYAGRLINGIDDNAKRQQTLVIAGDRIIDIKEGYTMPAADEQVVDLKNYTVMPGLMDMHTHLSTQYSEHSYTERFTMNEADYAYRSVGYAKKTLMAGFTTVRDLGDIYNVTVALRNAINSGLVTGPRIFTAAKSIATTGGHADPTNGFRKDLMHSPQPEQGVINGVAEAREAVRQRYKDGADLIKITATGGVLSVAKSGQNPQFMRDELEAIVSTAKDYGFSVAVHAHGAEGMKRAIKAGVDSIEHGTFMDDEVIRLMKKHGTFYVPTILAGNWVAEKALVEGFFPELVRPKAAKVGPQIQKTFAKAYRKGVKIAFGTDSGVSAHGDNAREFELMVEAGMKPMEAIQAATFNAASLLRREEDLGSLQTGKVADVVAVEGDPLENIALMKTVKFVMKAGQVYKNETVSAGNTCATP